MMPLKISIHLFVSLFLALLATKLATADWYTFSPASDHDAPSVIGMQDWSAEPAGAHGRILMQNDKLVYNGRAIKLWGLNNTYADAAPTKAIADKRASFYRKFGINSIRLHKFADGPNWQGIQSADSFVNFDLTKLDQFDYFVSVLKQAGIFVKLSPTFGVRFGSEDYDRVPFRDEIDSYNSSTKRIEAKHGWVYLSDEIAQLQIDQMVNLLNHTNPYTGLRYADDPAIFCVEIYNEDSALWFNTQDRLRASPTMRQRHGRSFANWLLAKYGDEATWISAWGENVIISDPSNIANSSIANMAKNLEGDLLPEDLDDGTVVPWGNPWFYDAILTDTSQAPVEQRMLDTIKYLISIQDAFYEKYVEVIRETGYEGEILASNWQAGSHAGHFQNLYSDYKIGIIDRHNYFGGGDWNGGTFNNAAMLSQPGSGYLSAGFQQVDDRPFMLSEWIHVQPNEWYAEGPAILGAYGTGLQGWDVSYIFQNKDDGIFSNKLFEHRWDATNPAVLLPFAAISRQVRRMDVFEAAETTELNVHMPSVAENQLSFLNKTTQDGDIKSFETNKVPKEALAATRVAVKFIDEYTETSGFDLDSHKDGDTIVSTTQQLRWTPGAPNDKTSGYFTIDTPATKAFVGFAPGGVQFDLGGGYAITPEEGFAVVYLTAKGRHQTLDTATEIIVTAVARARNTGMTMNADENGISSKGGSPVLLEAVKASIALPFEGEFEVLDQDGIAPIFTSHFNGSVSIDGNVDKTPFYRIIKESVPENMNIISEASVIFDENAAKPELMQLTVKDPNPSKHYTIETSEDLESWAAAAIFPSPTSAKNDRLTGTVSISLEDGQNAKFARAVSE